MHPPKRLSIEIKEGELTNLERNIACNQYTHVQVYMRLYSFLGLEGINIPVTKRKIIISHRNKCEIILNNQGIMKITCYTIQYTEYNNVKQKK